MEEKIYKIITNKKFRAGPLPEEETKKLIIEAIKAKILEEKPIEFLQFWGGCKNPNLGVDEAELCEETTMDNLNQVNCEVKKIYSPGLKINICPGDRRVERINLIQENRTRIYVETLTNLANQQKYNGLFLVVPVSVFYEKYADYFEKNLENIRNRISRNIEAQPGFEKLVFNAKKNIYKKNLKTEADINAQSIESAKNYIIFRVAEEEAKIFRDFKGCIRSFFIKYTPFYKKYIDDVDQTIPSLNCFLTFFTGKKGNVTQPWQAIGKEESGKILFLSQTKITNQ